jgi:hypothetical protein
MCKSIRDDFKNCVSCEILKVVDIRFYHDAIDAINDLGIVLVESELGIRFAELDLLTARSGTGMEKSGIVLNGELPRGRVPDLIDESAIAPSEKAILRWNIRRAPAELLRAFPVLV